MVFAALHMSAVDVVDCARSRRPPEPTLITGVETLVVAGQVWLAAA
jgi:hypothetical protein